MTRDQKALWGIIISVSFFLVIAILYVDCNKNITKTAVVSPKSQIVRDYLDGKKIRGEDAWWIHISDRAGFYKSAAKELKLDSKFIFEELDNYYVVRRPQKK